MTTEQFIADIPADLAYSAYSGTSFSPERRGNQTRDDYAATLAKDYADLFALAEKNSTRDLLDAEFSRYREGYSKRVRAYLHSSSRCVSTMIAGPSNFPARRMNKRADIAHKRLEDMLDFRTRALQAIHRTLCPGLRPIMSGDSDAVERLKEKIETAEREHAQMKALNEAHKAFLKNPESLDTSTLSDKAKAIVRTYNPANDCFHCPHPIAPYQFTNSSANIRRMKERLAALEKTKAQPARQVQGEIARFEDCPAENRVRLFFPGKPSVEVRDRLKLSGFRWAPSIGCWQAYRNQATYDFAKKEAGCAEVQRQVAA